MKNLIRLLIECRTFTKTYSSPERLNPIRLETVCKIPAMTKFSTVDNMEANSKVTVNKTIEPPINQCCMEGCINCVWLEYADSLINNCKEKLTPIDIQSLLEKIERDVDNPNVRSYLKFEIQSKLK